ncbi:MAG TPA: hypothetical protein VKR58_08180, partial [Aquella sp.]|nr:hypothetical protein [Aquella sp.]
MMKKYLGLFLLLAQNVCAMELIQSPQALKHDKKYKKAVITPEYDEKCKLVAKYLYHYPAGRGDKKEVRKIKWFLTDTRPKHAVPFRLCVKETDIRPKRVALMLCINKYMKMLKSIEAEETLYNINTGDLLLELKQRILTESLCDKAQQYYVLNNTAQFINMELRELNAYYVYANGYQHRFKECFLSEVNESNNIIMMFSESQPSDNHLCEFTELFVIYLNCKISDVKEFNELMRLYKTIFMRDHFNFDLPSTCQDFSSFYCHFEKEKLEELNAFLNARWDRVNAFKNKFTEQI